MGLVDQALKSTEQYANAYGPRLGAYPKSVVAVMTCITRYVRIRSPTDARADIA
jgi:hypothetical protein